MVRGGALFQFCFYWEGLCDLQFHTIYSILSPVILLLLIPLWYKVETPQTRMCMDYSYLNVFNPRALGDYQLSKMAFSDLTLPALIGVWSVCGGGQGNIGQMGSAQWQKQCHIIVESQSTTKHLSPRILFGVCLSKVVITHANTGRLNKDP